MATLPNRVVGTYWSSDSALRLNTLDEAYNVVWIGYATPTGALDGGVQFDANAYPSKTTFKADMAELRDWSAPPKIILSAFGSASMRQVINSNATADKFAAGIIAICRDYGFDGLDWHIDSPGDYTAAAMERATRTIKDSMGPGFILTAAPHLSPSLTEWPGDNNGRIYADFVRRCKDILDLVSPQYYNRGPTFNGVQVYSGASRWSVSHIASQTQDWISQGLRQDQVGMLFMFTSSLSTTVSELTTTTNADDVWDTVSTAYVDVRGLSSGSMAVDSDNSWTFVGTVGPNVLDNDELIYAPVVVVPGSAGVMDDFNVSPTAPPVGTGTVGVMDDYNVAPAAPDAPVIATDLVVAAHDEAATLLWTHDGTNVLSWRVQAISGTLSRTYTIAEPTARSLALAGLVNDLVWTLSVVSLGESGDSEPATTTVTPLESAGVIDGTLPDPVPPSPPVLTAVVDGPASIYATWTASVDDEGRPLMTYVVIATATTIPVGEEDYPVFSATVPADQLAAVVTGVTNDLDYVVTVQAVTTGGTSIASNSMAGAPTAAADPLLPSPVTALALDARSRGAALSWTNADLGIGNFVRFDIAAYSATESLSYQFGTFDDACEIAGLLNDVEYTVSVVVRTTVGVSTAETDTVTPDSSEPILGAFALLPIVPDAPEPEIPTTPPRAKKTQPMIEGFPVDRPFHPQNSGLTQEEVDARG